MAYPVAKLITNSYYLSGVASRKLQTVSGDMIEDGLDLLNGLLAVKSGNVRLIPYFTRYNFTAIAGTEEYFIPNLVSVETLTFFINNVRYSMNVQKREIYWGEGRVNNINSLPFEYNVTRVKGGTNIYLYFSPQQNYPLELWGKFQLTDVTLNQDLSLTYDRFYIEYLRYALAEQICNDYNIELKPNSAGRLKELESIIMYIEPPDLTNKNFLPFSGTSWSYADVSLGLGWRPR